MQNLQHIKQDMCEYASLLLKPFLCVFLGDQYLEIIFFYLPAGISLPMNVVLFVLILKRIQYVQHEANRLEEGTLQATDSKIQKFLNKKRKK